MQNKNHGTNRGFLGAGGRNRTPDLLITRCITLKINGLEFILPQNPIKTGFFIFLMTFLIFSNQHVKFDTTEINMSFIYDILILSLGIKKNQAFQLDFFVRLLYVYFI